MMWMALLSPGPETPVEDAASPYGTSAARPMMATGRRGPLPPRLQILNRPQRGEREQGEAGQRADVGERPRRPVRGSLGSRKRRVIHKNVLAYTTSVAATTFRRVQRLRQPRLSGRPPVSRPEPSPARCFSIASLLTPPTATPRFGLPMLSGGPGVRVGSLPVPRSCWHPPQASVHKETGRDGGDRRRTAHDPTTAASPRLSEHDHDRGR